MISSVHDDSAIAYCLRHEYGYGEFKLGVRPDREYDELPSESTRADSVPDPHERRHSPYQATSRERRGKSEGKLFCQIGGYILFRYAFIRSFSQTSSQQASKATISHKPILTIPHHPIPSPSLFINTHSQSQPSQPHPQSASYTPSSDA